MALIVSDWELRDILSAAVFLLTARPQKDRTKNFYFRGKTTTIVNLLDFYKGYFHTILVFSPTVESGIHNI